MIRLEQVRGEMLERFERVDRRFAQNEQRVGRMEQRLAELADRLEALREELLAQLELLSWATSDTARLGDPGIESVFEPGPENVEPCEEVVVSGFSRTHAGPPDQPPLKLRRSPGASAKAEGGHDDG